jgi:hypothetical protein
MLRDAAFVKLREGAVCEGKLGCIGTADEIAAFGQFRRRHKADDYQRAIQAIRDRLGNQDWMPTGYMNVVAVWCLANTALREQFVSEK